MTKKGVKPMTNGAGDRSAIDLARDLADRERQLRDLTEQALGFLEELAESRRLNAKREELVVRIGDLERALADARQRLLHAGGCVVGAPERGATQVPLAVAFWGNETFTDAAACSAFCSQVPVLWVGPPASVPAKGPAGKLQVVVHRDTFTEAQCWNLAMASTTAECVLLLGPGARLLREPSLSEAVSPNAAVLCPRIERNKAFEIGCEESDDVLRLRPRLVTGDSGTTAVPWPAAQAFVVRRAAFDRVGLFDESLFGPAALLEFALRARLQNFEVFALPGLEVSAGARSTSPESPTDQRMRLLLLAAHRPSKLGKALAETRLLWTLGTEAPGFLAELLAHLPAGELAEQRALLDQICVGLIATAMPSHDVARRVAAARAELLRAFAGADLPAGKDELAARLPDDEAAEGPPEAAFEALARDIALCARLAAATASTARQIRAEVQALDVERHAHMARAEQSEGARSAAQAQLDQVQRWLVEARQELRQSHETRHELAQRLDQANSELARSQQQLQAAVQAHDETERKLRELHGHFNELARVAALSDTAAPDKLHERLTQLHQDSLQLAATLRAAGAADAQALLANLDSVGQRLDAAVATVGERERWIAMLLDEVGKRRLFPRSLLDHERALLERVRRTP
jgi:predicted  nucleic acid-binding Zn-ribbon protein